MTTTLAPLCTLRRLEPPPPPPRYAQSPKAKNFLLHFRTLEWILRGSCEKKSVGVGTVCMLGSHVPGSVSPQPYELIQWTIYYCDPLQGYNKLSLTSNPTNIPIKSYWIGLIPMHTIFSFLVWPISPPPFTFTKGDIAEMIDLLEPNLLLSYNIFPSRSYQKLLWGLWFSYRNFWQDHHPQPIKFIRPSNISIMLRV